MRVAIRMFQKKRKGQPKNQSKVVNVTTLFYCFFNVIIILLSYNEG